MVVAGDGGLQRHGHPNTLGYPFVAEYDALAYAAGVASASTTDSVYVMTVFDNGKLSIATICRPNPPVIST